MNGITAGSGRSRRERFLPLTIGGVVVGVAVLFVAFSLTRPEPETFLPSPILRGDQIVQTPGPQQRTVDASDAVVWRLFSFDRGSVVDNPGPLDWDVGFRRFQVIVNGGPGLPGDVGVQILGEGRDAFEEVVDLPTDGYLGPALPGDSVAPPLERWYDYSFLSHLLTPKPRVYVVRTVSGGYAKMEFLGYYCPGPIPGCITFRYEYHPP